MRSVRPPICEFCDSRFSPREGALISFQSHVTPGESTAPDSVPGHPHNQGWFCPVHMEDAEALADRTLRAALDELRSPMRAPGATQRRLFAQVSQTRVVASEPRSPEGIRRSVIQVRKLLAPMLLEPLNSLGSSSSRLPLPNQPIYASAVDYRRAVSVARAERESLHVTTKSCRCREGRFVASSTELVVTRDDQIVLAVELIPEHDNSLEYRSLVIHEDPEFTSDPKVRAAIEGMVAAFNVTESDPSALAPDLLGVDLCGGRLAGSVEFETRVIEWDIAPTSVGRLEDLVRENLESIMVALGYEQVLPMPPLQSTTNRSWNPMDGSKPSDCPFTDRSVSSASIGTAAGPVDVAIDRTQTHWNERDVANASTSLLLRGPGDDEPFLLSAHAPKGVVASVLRLRRPARQAAITLVAGLAKSLVAE